MKLRYWISFVVAAIYLTIYLVYFSYFYAIARASEANWRILSTFFIITIPIAVCFVFLIPFLYLLEKSGVLQ